jgi:hypothetical protein
MPLKIAISETDGWWNTRSTVLHEIEYIKGMTDVSLAYTVLHFLVTLSTSPRSVRLSVKAH